LGKESVSNKKVIIIAMDQPLDGEADLKSRMANAEKRAHRNSPRFHGFDLLTVQKNVHENLLKLQLFLDGRHMGLLELINYAKNKRRSPNLTPDNASKYYLHANGFTLNGVYLYQYLLMNGYDPVVVQNFSLINPKDLLQEKPLAVCMSSTFTYLDDLKEVAEQIKKYDPAIPVIAGGLLVKKILDAGQDIPPQTSKWISTFYGKIDAFVVEKCGEETLIKVLDALGNKKPISTIENLSLFDHEGRLFFTPRSPEIHHVDGTAIAWDKIPREYLRKTLSVLTSRGCNFRCRFCNYRLWFPKVQYKSIDVLRDELRRIQRLGFVKHVRFADDNLTTNSQRLKAFTKMMIEEKFEFTWSSHARVNFLTPEIVKLMKLTGCDLLVMGIESGNQTILNNMDKKITLKQAFDAIRALEEYGIDSQSSFIIGYPGETSETFYDTVDLIISSGLKYWQAYLFYYAKDMLVYKDRKKFGIEGLGRAWRHNTMDSMEASYLISQMVPMIENGFTDGQQNAWETYKLLRGEGYSRDDIFQLHKLKREMQLAVQPAKPQSQHFKALGNLLDKLDALIK
jgi:radical SAM superfamily enzyme YgiQ (UPF0313 family)